MLLYYCASFSEIIAFVQLPYFVGDSLMLLRFADILELSFYLLYSSCLLISQWKLTKGCHRLCSLSKNRPKRMFLPII